jgi:FMN-dependent NADH-azoreductase
MSRRVLGCERQLEVVGLDLNELDDERFEALGGPGAGAQRRWSMEKGVLKVAHVVVALAATLIDELAAADAQLFAVPLYNFGVSQHLKTWVDLVVTDPRMGAGSDPIIAGRPAVLATVHGGAYGRGTPREGWDHATGWMRRILQDVWKLDLRVVESEFTLVGVNPQLDQFKELAAQMRSEAEQLARAHGRSLSPKLAA